MAKYVAVRLDHEDARMFHIDPERSDDARSQEGDRSHPDDAKDSAPFGRTFADAEQPSRVGRWTAKLSFLRYAHAHEPSLEQGIVGIEPVDHPSDGQRFAHAKRYFGVRDRVR